MKEKRPGKQDDSSTETGFDLGAPTHVSRTGDASPKTPEKPGARPKPVADRRIAADSKSSAEWKGFEEEEEYAPEVDFGHSGVREDEMDMTPMVDVVFLLLIFFMVTAAFTLQRAIEQPPNETDDPSENVEQREDDDQYVEIIVDQFNAYRLTSKDVEEVEAPSDQEMRTRLRDMIMSTSAVKVIITAHGDATHEKVVTAWDAATDNDVSDIVVRISEADY